ncbi:MAG: DUF4143 domain-containing protein [Erysipelotrichaceae bacterium]|nr:DUF4143 domain-containing protein [Erysipelotrichaceae bacterium]
MRIPCACSAVFKTSLKFASIKTLKKVQFLYIKTLKKCILIECNLDGIWIIGELQAETGVDLYPYQSLIIFDEIQFFPKARQAIKHLVADGRYHYLETGSLIFIKKNVKDILIPSEEMKILVNPLDYEEFCLATNKPYRLIQQIYQTGKPIGQSTNRKLMKDLRVYMAVGGMPQAIEAYLDQRNFSYIDRVKREIIFPYEEDFKKIDPSGRISTLYRSIPAQLASGNKKFRISSALQKRKSKASEELIYGPIDSKTVLPCYNILDPSLTLNQSKDFDAFKLYLADTGLFVTLMFIDRKETDNILYTKLFSDKLSANLGFLYKIFVAQTIAATKRELYYHTWNRPNSTHYYEIDFLFSKGNKLCPIEVKSSGVGKHESLNAFLAKYSSLIGDAYLLSQKDVGHKGNIKKKPFYMAEEILQ